MPNATSNLTRFYISRWNEAAVKYETEKHDECIHELVELLCDESFPPMLRLQANMLVAMGIDDWHAAEECRIAAERVYAQIRERHPLGDTRYPAQESDLVGIREEMDELRDAQLADDPSNFDTEEGMREAETGKQDCQEDEDGNDNETVMADSQPKSILPRLPSDPSVTPVSNSFQTWSLRSSAVPDNDRPVTASAESRADSLTKQGPGTEIHD